MVIGSSGLPSSFISCMSAFPMEVTRNMACACLPSASGVGGLVFSVPSRDTFAGLTMASPAEVARPEVWRATCSRPGPWHLSQKIPRMNPVFLYRFEEPWGVKETKYEVWHSKQRGG